MTEPTRDYDPVTGRSRHGGDTDPSPDQASGRGGVDAGAILEQIREVVDDLALRAAPAVKQVSAKAAEVIATAADRAAPLAQRAGEATAEASGKLAERSRTWASEVRDQLGGDDRGGRAAGEAGGTAASGTGTSASGTRTAASGTGTAASGTGGGSPGVGSTTGATGGSEFPGSAPADEPVADAPTDTISNG